MAKFEKFEHQVLGNFVKATRHCTEHQIPRVFSEVSGLCFEYAESVMQAPEYVAKDAHVVGNYAPAKRLCSENLILQVA